MIAVTLNKKGEEKMGLDMFLYGVKRVKEEDVPSVVTEEWIENTGLRNADIDRINAKDLLPYSAFLPSPCIQD